MDVEFALMLDHGETLKLKDLNASFQDPRKISLAYFEASLLVEHMVTAYGEAGLNKLLRAYGQGLDTDAALKSALNTDLDQLQVGFDQSLERMFGGLRRALAAPPDADLSRMPVEQLRALAGENPRSYPVLLAYALALRKAGQTDDAVAQFERAAALVPIASGKDSPHAQMAEIALQKKDRARAVAELTALVAADYNNVDAARRLAGLLKESGVDDPAKTRPVYERIVAIDPYDGDAHAALGRLAMQRNEADAASREFRAVLALGPVDEAGAHTDLAESYLKAGKRADAKKQTLAALEIAPTYERAQDLLLKLSGGSAPR
jgi:tetratricopeptide (TPR) repeat protein